MRALLDTHTFIWAATEDPRLSSDAIEAIADDEFNLKVEALNPGIVKFNWDAPKTMDVKTETFILLHSAQPDPTHPGAFWYRKSGVDREGTWGNIPSGKRFFRICEFKGNQCVRYSKTIEVEMK